MTHGHKYHVKSGYGSVLYAGQVRHADILLFGHTHIPFCMDTGDMLAVNPGSVGLGTKTYAVLNIEHGDVTCEEKILE